MHCVVTLRTLKYVKIVNLLCFGANPKIIVHFPHERKETSKLRAMRWVDAAAAAAADDDDGWQMLIRP